MINPTTCQALTDQGVPLDASDLNLPSIGIYQLAGTQTIQRTVTNVEDERVTFRVSVDAPPGIDVQVTPPVLRLPRNGSASYSVTFTNTGATMDAWTFGALSWRGDDDHRARSPIALYPVALSVPDKLTGDSAQGFLSYNIKFGYGGEFAARVHGLVPASTQEGSVADDPTNDFSQALANNVGVSFHTITVAPGSEYLRVSLFDSDTSGQDDLDLYVFGPASDGDPFVDASASFSSNEEVNVTKPAPGVYTVIVHGYDTENADSQYTLYTWSLGATDEGNMTINAPQAAALGTQESIDLSWNGLSALQKYLGMITYHKLSNPAGFDDALLQSSVVRIDVQ
jgi:hypothetical protein